MKKTALITLSMIAAVSVLAQGTINFVNNASGLKAPVYAPELSNPTARITGNDASGLPAGNAVYTGAKLAGTGFTVALWAGPNANSLQQWSTSTFRTGTAAGFWTGIGNAVVGNVGPGQSAVVEIRVWDNAGGTINSWDAAITRGHSEQFTLATLGGTDPVGGIFLTPNLVGMTSFNLQTIPEPSIVGLGILGGLGLFLIRRRK